MRNTLLGSALALALAGFAADASALVINVGDVDLGTGAGPGGFTFTPTGGALGIKTIEGPAGVFVTGLGVTGGPSGNEIDVGESLTIAGPAFVLGSLGLAFLYDGPEFGDVQEIALITATLLAGGTSVTRVINVFVDPTDTDVDVFVDGTLDNSLIISASEASDGVASQILLGKLFGDAVVTSLVLEAVNGACGSGTCDNQSDYSFLSLTTVPEPATLGIVGGGLVAMGLLGRRRRA
jgi:hypothetical protein